MNKKRWNEISINTINICKILPAKDFLQFAYFSSNKNRIQIRHNTVQYHFVIWSPQSCIKLAICVQNTVESVYIDFFQNFPGIPHQQDIMTFLNPMFFLLKNYFMFCLSILFPIVTVWVMKENKIKCAQIACGRTHSHCLLSLAV